MDQRFYTALSTRELVTELENRAERVPIDMTNVEVSARALSHVLGAHEAKEHELRPVAIGYLMLLDSLTLDMERKIPPRAEDGDIIFAHHSWAPGAKFEELLRSLVIAAKTAQLQRADAMDRAGLSDLAARDHRRDMLEELNDAEHGS